MNRQMFYRFDESGERQAGAWGRLIIGLILSWMRFDSAALRVAHIIAASHKYIVYYRELGWVAPNPIYKSGGAGAP